MANKDLSESKDHVDAKFPCYYDEFKSFTGVVIIPLKGNDPVLIFKDYGAPFYFEIGGAHAARGHEQKDALNNYMVYWKGNYFYHKLPQPVIDEYGNFFSELIENKLPTHLTADELPNSC